WTGLPRAERAGPARRGPRGAGAADGVVGVGPGGRRAGAALAGRGDEQLARVRHGRARAAGRTADRRGSARAWRFGCVAGPNAARWRRGYPRARGGALARTAG